MSKTKMMIHFFTIADFEEEEQWLRKQHSRGWKLVQTVIPCFYFFEACEPEEVIYRLDFKNHTDDSDYRQMFEDYGWEYFNTCMGWLYFRKPLASMESEQEGEIFSDYESKSRMIEHIIKKRMLPVMAIFCACVVPQWSTAMFLPRQGIYLPILSLLFLLYVWLILHCGLKLKRLRSKYENRM